MSWQVCRNCRGFHPEVGSKSRMPGALHPGPENQPVVKVGPEAELRAFIQKEFPHFHPLGVFDLENSG